MKPQIYQKNVQYIPITAEYQKQRIDNYLFRIYSKIPKSHIYKIIRSGEVRVNGRRITASYKLNENDKLRIPPLYSYQNRSGVMIKAAKKFPIDESIIFENDLLLVLNKPSGVAVHGGNEECLGLIEQVREHFKLSDLHLAHRIDKETSGCLVLTKRRSALREIHRLFRENSVEKTYLALLKGLWPLKERMLRNYVKKSRLASGERWVKVVNDAEEGKIAETKVKVLKELKDTTLVEVSPKTGRTHQIRVHTAYKGFPIVGDDKYGDRSFNDKFFTNSKSRLLLHAYKLNFTLNGQKILLTAPLSPELEVYFK